MIFKDIVENLKKKFGYLDLHYRRIAKVGAKVGVKVATFHKGLLPSTNDIVNGTFFSFNKRLAKGASFFCTSS